MEIRGGKKRKTKVSKWRGRRWKGSMMRIEVYERFCYCCCCCLIGTWPRHGIANVTKFRNYRTEITATWYRIAPADIWTITWFSYHHRSHMRTQLRHFSYDSALYLAAVSTRPVGKRGPNNHYGLRHRQETCRMKVLGSVMHRML
jgi:hypothetical protein